MRTDTSKMQPTKEQKAAAKAAAQKALQAKEAPVAPPAPPPAPQTPTAAAAALPVGTPVAPAVSAGSAPRYYQGELPQHFVRGPRVGRYNAAGAANAWSCIEAALAKAQNGLAATADYLAATKEVIAQGRACNGPIPTFRYFLAKQVIALPPTGTPAPTPVAPAAALPAAPTAVAPAAPAPEAKKPAKKKGKK